MLVAIVSLRVKSGQEERFLEAIERQAETSLRTESGCLRFEVLRRRDDPLAFTLYEVYVDDASYFEIHRSTAHFAEWTATAAEVLDGERTTTLLAPVRA